MAAPVSSSASCGSDEAAATPVRSAPAAASQSVAATVAPAAASASVPDDEALAQIESIVVRLGRAESELAASAQQGEEVRKAWRAQAEQAALLQAQVRELQGELERSRAQLGNAETEIGALEQQLSAMGRGADTQKP